MELVVLDPAAKEADDVLVVALGHHLDLDGQVVKRLLLLQLDDLDGHYVSRRRIASLLLLCCFGSLSLPSLSLLFLLLFWCCLTNPVDRAKRALCDHGIEAVDDVRILALWCCAGCKEAHAKVCVDVDLFLLCLLLCIFCVLGGSRAG